MVEKLTKDLLNKIVAEIKKEENQQKIEIEILNPILFTLSNKIYPYIKIGGLIFVLNFILIIAIFILIIFFNCNKPIFVLANG
jgi:hypothetical protein